jgi:hypothetical protein
MWNDVKWCCLGATIVCRNSKKEFVRIFRLLARFDEDVKVVVVIEAASINELIFAVKLSTPSILLDQIFIRESAVRILVEIFHVGVLPESVIA